MTNKDLAEIIERYRHSPEFMLTDFTDVNSRGMTGDTLLHSAVITAATNDVKILIKSGADVNAQGDLGYTPLHHAASRGLGQIAKILLASGANTELKNEFAQTPGDLAILQDHRGLAALLRTKR